MNIVCLITRIYYYKIYSFILFILQCNLHAILHIVSRILYVLSPTNNYDYSEFKVENMEELQRVRNELLTKPILFHIKVEHNKTEHYVVMKVRKVWRGLFPHCFVVVFMENNAAVLGTYSRQTDHVLTIPVVPSRNNSDSH